MHKTGNGNQVVKYIPTRADYDRLLNDIVSVIKNTCLASTTESFDNMNFEEILQSTFVTQLLVRITDDIAELLETWRRIHGRHPRFSVLVEAIRNFFSDFEEDLFNDVEKILSSFEVSGLKVSSLEDPKSGDSKEVQVFLQGFSSVADVCEEVLMRFFEQITPNGKSYMQQDFEEGAYMTWFWLGLEPSIKTQMVCSIIKCWNFPAFSSLWFENVGSFSKKAGLIFDQMSISRLLTGSCSFVVEEPGPGQAEFYVQRRLTNSRMVLDRTVHPDVFKVNPKTGALHDVFFVKEIMWSQLSKLACKYGRTTARSSSQIDTEVDKIILLEDESDFWRIYNLARYKHAMYSFHLLRYDSEVFHLENTIGSVKNIQDFLSTLLIEIDEAQFIHSLPDNAEPVCISASMGMGKTWLLLSMARQISKSKGFQNRIVFFIDASDFLREYLAKNVTDNVKQDLIVNLLVDRLTSDKYPPDTLSKLICSLDNRIELFLDNLNGLNKDEIQAAGKLMQYIRQTFTNFRLHLANDPAYSQHLEDVLGVQAYNLLPFNESDQIYFLTRYWYAKYRKELETRCDTQLLHDSDGFQNFAENCARIIDCTISQFERKYAGNPFHCRLLADVYYDFVVPNATQNRIYGIELPFKSTFEIIKSNLELFSKSNEHKKQRSDFFAFYGFSALFPELYANKSDFNFGMHPSTESLRFVYLKFGEFCLAESLYKTSISGRCDLSPKPTDMVSFANVIFNWVLETTRRTISLYPSSRLNETVQENVSHRFLNRKTSAQPTFIHSTLIDFLNSHIGLNSSYTVSLWLTICVNRLYPRWRAYRKFMKLLKACANGAYDNVILLIRQAFPIDKKLGYWKWYVTSSDIRILFVLAARHDKKRLFHRIYLVAKLLTGKGLHEMRPGDVMAALFVAARHGNYSVVEYIFNELSGHWEKIRFVLHACTHNSIDDSISVIEKKKQIILLLNELDGRFLHEIKSAIGLTPLMMSNIHVSLMKLLIELDHSNCLCPVTTTYGSTFMHMALEYVSKTEFDEIVSLLIAKEKSSVLLVHNKLGKSVIENALAIGIETKTVEKILKWIQNWRGAELLDLLIGDKEVSFNCVVNTLMSSPASSVLVRDWTKLCTHLNTPYMLRETLSNEILLNKQTHSDALQNILRDWRSRESENATLDKFLEHLKDCDWNDMAAALSSKITNEMKLLVAVKQLTKNNTIETKIPRRDRCLLLLLFIFVLLLNLYTYI